MKEKKNPKTVTSHDNETLKMIAAKLTQTKSQMKRIFYILFFKTPRETAVLRLMGRVLDSEGTSQKKVSERSETCFRLSN